MENDELDLFGLAVEAIEAGRLDEGIQILEGLAKRGSARGATLLGYHLLESDRLSGLKWLRIAWECGDEEAAFQLGLDERNHGRSDLAFEWYKKAALKGSVPAAAHLGHLALNDPKLSEEMRVFGLEMMKWASEKGHVFALRYLSIAWRRGFFGRPSFSRWLWYSGQSVVAFARHCRNPKSDYLR